MSLLEVDALSLATRGVPILRNVSLAVEAGRIAGVVGESGAGKSMLGKAVLGILPRDMQVTGGTIRLEEQELLRLSPGRRRRMRRNLALIPQDPMTALNPCRKISAQVGEVLRAAGVADVARETIRLLDAVRIPAATKVAGSFPHELSGGMRQRVLIAAAFAGRPKLVVADEPTTALDVTVQQKVLRLIKSLQAETGVGLMFVTHDLCVVAKICDTVTVMHGGRVVEQGDCDQVLNSPRHAYTRALLTATPRHDRSGHRLAPVPAALVEAVLAETRDE